MPNTDKGTIYKKKNCENKDRRYDAGAQGRRNVPSV